VIEEVVRRAPGAPNPETKLTERELEALKLLTRGRSNAEIAHTLVVSDATAKTHVAHLLMKLGVRDRVQAVIYAYESGLIQPGHGPSA
jgi:DNA-binding NarL/FixJ family response regulator